MMLIVKFSAIDLRFGHNVTNSHELFKN